ncbi:Uncharacterised protein [uncultured Ruminococcus sp.]|nr:Uncharacterised protein [uncultured Ruminococcus sp.]
MPDKDEQERMETVRPFARGPELMNWKRGWFD